MAWGAALAGTEYEKAPSRSDSCRLACGPKPLFEPWAASLSSRCRFFTARLRMMLMVPATDWVENSALAARSTSKRSIESGASDSIEKPAGARSPLTSTWV